ncbi:MAG: MFS transporter [Geminicoccaceae bacterium]
MGGGRTLLAIAACCLGMFAVGENSTAVMAAVPTMGRELAASPATLTWIVNAYLLASAACIIAGGRFGDALGAPVATIGGLVLFAAGAALIALSGSAGLAIAGRTIQGMGAALAVPGSLAAVRLLAPESSRSTAISAWAGFLMLGFSLGPLVGGVIVHVLGWRAVFVIVAASTLVAALLLGIGSPRSSGPAPRIGTRPDLAGFVVIAAGMVGLVWALHGLAVGLLDVVVPLAVAVLAMLLLAPVERRAAVPLLDLALLASPTLLVGCAVGAVAMLGIMTFLLFESLALQATGGLSAVAAGLALLPLSAALFATALASPRVVAALGIRTALTLAMALVIMGMLGLMAAGASPWARGLALLATGAGLALPYASAPRLALAALPPAKAGQASGVVSACTFLGGSAGIAAGGLAEKLAGLDGVLAMIALAAVLGILLARMLSSAAPSPAA